MSSDTATFPAAYGPVTNALWRQRDALQALALAAARGHAAAEIEDLQLGEVLRSVEVEPLTRLLNLAADASLDEIAAASPEPWQTVLLDHLTALRGLYTLVTGVAVATGRPFWQQSLDDFLR